MQISNLKPQVMRPKPARTPLAPSPPRLLVVDDDNSMRVMCVRMLRPRYEVVECAAATDALEYLESNGADVLLTDLDMPGMNGLTLIERARIQHPDLPTLMMTATAGGDSRRERAESMGIPVLSKPFSQAQLLEFLETGGLPRRPG